MKSQKVIYYKDELNDDFSGTSIKQKPLGSKFKYVHNNIFWCTIEFVLYYLIAAPLIFIIQKIYSHQKFENRKVLKKVKSGYFIYSNHTQYLNDAFIGPLATFPKKAYIIANPDATSIFGLRSILQMLGVIPLATTFSQTKEMISCIDKRIKQNSAVMIYPEAHIWPYYTRIRPFVYNSFKYPVQLDVPVFCITNCYQKRKFSKRPKIVSYVDGPFYPRIEGTINQKAIDLRDQVYETMCKRSEQYSTYEYVRYEKVKSN